MTLRKELSEIKTDLKEAHADLQTKAETATINILKTIENLKEELSEIKMALQDAHEDRQILRGMVEVIIIDTIREKHSETQTTLKDAQDDLQNLKNLARAAMVKMDTGVTVKEKKKSTIQEYVEPACKIVKGLSGPLGLGCDIGVYVLNLLHDIMSQ